MFRHRSIKTVSAIVMVLLAVWVALPKFYVHALFNHQHTPLEITNETSVQSKADDCDFEKYDKPAYFNLFKFICSFIPDRARPSGNISLELFFFTQSLFTSHLERGPPAY